MWLLLKEGPFPNTIPESVNSCIIGEPEQRTYDSIIEIKISFIAMSYEQTRKQPDGILSGF
jgi:hypothetical protein